jgi:ABC-type amino acid transport substrate-binding protein
MLVYESTADYIDTPELEAMGRIADTDNPGHFEELMKNGLMSNDFAFMMMEDNTALRDEFNDAIAAIKEDGTLEKLIEEHIDKAVADKSVTPAVELPSFEGADTIKVAVTGSLPPMDYVGPDGAPAGFSTAVLAEIANRLGKNIEIVVVDSVGRAAALASGVVDAVFWTRTNEKSNCLNAEDDDTRKEKIESSKAQLSEEELEVLDQIEEEFDFSSHGSLDMPEGTIITNSYYSDQVVPVALQTTIDRIKAAQ